MKKIILGILMVIFGVSLTACRQQSEKKVIKEKKVEPDKKDNEGLLEKAGKKVDKKVNKEADKQLDKIDDDDDK